MDSRYQVPSLEELNQFISNLESNSQTSRSTTIKFLQSLKVQSPNADKILLGAIIYVTEKIACEYKVFSPNGGYINKGSSLYKELNTGPHNNSTNQLDDKQRLIYLRDFYKFAKEAKLTLSSTETKDPQALDKAIKPVVDNIASRIPSEIKGLMVNRPLLSTLIKRTGDLGDDYKKIANAKPKSFFTTLPIINRFADYTPLHKKYAFFASMLTHPVMEGILPTLVDEKSMKSSESIDQHRYTICYGAIMTIMGQIESEYSGYTMYSADKNSTLYKICQDILNIKHLNDIPAIERLIYYQDFISFLDRVIADKKVLAIFKDELGPDTETLLKTLRASAITLSTSEPFLISCVKSVGNYALLYVLGTAFFEAGAVLYNLGIGKNVVTNMGAVIGRVLIGGKLGEYIGRSTGANIEPAVTISTLANTLWFLSRQIKDQVFPDVNYRPMACKAAKKFSLELSEEIKIDKSEKLFYEDEARKLLHKLEWMKAFLELPSTVSEKEKLRVMKAVIEPAEMKFMHNEGNEEDNEFTPRVKYISIL